MSFLTKYTLVGCAGLLLAACRKEDAPPVSAAASSPAGAGAEEAPLSGMSRKQREAHRILKASEYLEQGLTALTELERKGQLRWNSDNKPDLAAVAAALRSVREETARTESDETKAYHHSSLTLLNESMKQMIGFSNQAILPEGSKESREFAAALISASDVMETTSPLREKGLGGAGGSE